MPSTKKRAVARRDSAPRQPNKAGIRPGSESPRAVTVGGVSAQISNRAPRGSRADGWSNILTGLGTSRDKRTATVVVPAYRWDRGELAELYLGDDVAGTIVDLPANEMVREWFKVTGEGIDAALQDDIQQALVKIECKTKVLSGLKWSRLFGGSGTLLGADDGLDTEDPLHIEGIRSLSFLTTLDRYELIPYRWYSDPMAPQFGRPSHYQISPIPSGGLMPSADLGRIVHESRVIRFEGVVVPNSLRGRYQGWGDSVLTRVRDVLFDYGAIFGGVANVMQDFSQTIFKMRGLSDALASEKSDLVLQRLQAMDLSRSVIRAVLLDAGEGPGTGEEFERKTTTLTGVEAVLDKFMQRLAQAARMPVTLMMGESPAGLNATGETDVLWFYNQIRAQQEDMLRPALERILKCVFLAKDGPTNGVEPKGWKIVFNPLWQLSEKEKTDNRYTQAQTDQIYLSRGVVDSAEIAMSRFGGDEYSSDTQLDMTVRDKAGALPEPDPSDLEKAQTKATLVKAGLPGGAGGGDDPGPQAPGGGVP